MAGAQSKTSNTDSDQPVSTYSKVRSLILNNNLESRLIQLSFSLVAIIMALVWCQYDKPEEAPSKLYTAVSTSTMVETIPDILTKTCTKIGEESANITHSKNGTGSDEDPVRFNPEIKKVATIYESSVITEDKDETKHPENYTTNNLNTSGLILREAVAQSTGTISEPDPTPELPDEEEAFGSVVYIGALADDGQVLNDNKTITTTASVKIEEVVLQPKLTIQPLTLNTLKLTSVAVRADEAPIISDDASIAKNENESYNEVVVDEVETEVSVSLTADASSTASATTDAIVDVVAEDDYEITSSEFLDLKNQAAIDGKMLLVRFTASWCIPCKMMEDNVYSNATVKAYMDEHFLSLKLDNDSFDGINLKQRYNVQRIPSVLFFDSDGELAAHYTKTMSSTAMLSILKDLQINNNHVVTDSLLTQSENVQEVLEFNTTPITK